MNELFIAFVIAVLISTLYLLPHLVAWDHDHPNKKSITVLNILCGWSLIGWVVLLVWALQVPKQSPTRN